MSNADMTSLGEEMLEEVTNVTTGLAAKKEKDTAKMITTMLDINDEGFNAFEISKNLNSFGVDTLKVNLDIKTRDEMRAWTTRQDLVLSSLKVCSYQVHVILPTRIKTSAQAGVAWL